MSRTKVCLSKGATVALYEVFSRALRFCSEQPHVKAFSLLDLYASCVRLISVVPISVMFLSSPFILQCEFFCLVIKT